MVCYAPCMPCNIADSAFLFEAGLDFQVLRGYQMSGQNGNHSSSEHERLAILEHRADRHEATLEKIEGWIHETRNFIAELVKLQTERFHDLQRLERLEQSFDQEREKRVKRERELSDALHENNHQGNTNADWIEMGKKIALTVITAGATFIIGISIGQ